MKGRSLRSCGSTRHPEVPPTQEQPASSSEESVALAQEPKRRGWNLVGPAAEYAFLQAMGLVNDHPQCFAVRPEGEPARQRFARPATGVTRRV